MRAKTTLLISLIVGLAAVLGLTAFTAPPQENEPVSIYFFWGDGCPHCAAAHPYLEALAEKYNAVLYDFEVWHNVENQRIFFEMAASFGFEPEGVPTIFVGDRYWVGFSEVVAMQIETIIAGCKSAGCPDPGIGIVPGIEAAPPGEPGPAGETGAAAEPGSETDETARAALPAEISLPLIGTISLESRSLPVSTAIIAFVDGFNPCSMWALGVLLALTLHTGSRRKVFVIGLTFITVTALVYVLFIAGLFTMLSVVSFLGWIQVVVALVALFFGLVNVKDYFWYKEGISFTIDDEKKPGIYKRMRAVLNAGDSWAAIISATVVLAAGVSLVEFSCTAGFPMIWTNLLTAQGVSGASFALLLLLYMVIYQIDELAIFGFAVFTLRTSKLEEKHGRLLKLVGGMLMLALAAVMLIDPSLMNEVSNTLWIFGGAFAAAGIVIFLHRTVLPKWGIRIGTELNEKRRRRGRRKARRGI